MADYRRHAVKTPHRWLSTGARKIPTAFTPPTKRGTLTVRGTLTMLAVLTTLFAAAWALLSIQMARTIVLPPKRRPEKMPIRAVDGAGELITLGVDAESVLPGNYSLFFANGSGHARVGEIVSRTKTTVTRRLLGVDSGVLARHGHGRISGWFYVSPADLGLPYSDVTIETDFGHAPAWLIPPARPSTKWVIQVHGRAVKRTETLRAVPVFHAAGYSSLLVSYRNDGDAPPSPDGRYGLGDTEWRDVQAALQFARARGATEVILMGWSMGGATVLQVLSRACDRDLVCGVVLDSPVIDWRSALDFQGRVLRLPSPIRSSALKILGHPLASHIIGLSAPIDLQRLNFVIRATELDTPILLMHSDGDDYIPIGPSAALAKSRPDLVTFERFDHAGHTKLWNYDPARFSRAIREWLIATQA